MPPSASSNLPRRRAAAPVNAPFSWPNSSLSISSVGMAAQLTLTNGPDANGLSRWMCAASSSLPVPDSPSRSTPASDRATWVASSTACRNAGARCRSSAARRRPARGIAGSRAADPIARARSSTTSRTRSRASGFSRKSNAPLARRIHGVANRAMARNHHHRRGLVALSHGTQQIDAVAVRQPDVQQVQVGAAAARARRETSPRTRTPSRGSLRVRGSTAATGRYSARRPR